jgi:serine/threonine protein kinase
LKNNQIKIGDLGLCNRFDPEEEDDFPEAGTPVYFSPEMALASKHFKCTDAISYLSDIW